MTLLETPARVTLGAQGLVTDTAGRVLLIRHAYRPGWHFPGGGVERGEPVTLALARELEEEAGILIEGAPTLFGLYTHFDIFPNDHIALYLVTSWRQPIVPAPNREIAEQGFFALDRLPAGIHRSTKARLSEAFGGEARRLAW